MYELRLVISSAVLGTLFGICLSQAYGQGNSAVYNSLGHLKGTVWISNHPTLGKTPANFFELVFRRVGCNKCLVGTRTDIDGKYDLILGEGRYEIIVFSPSTPIYDLIAPNQPRMVKVSSGIMETQFDVLLKLQTK